MWKEKIQVNNFQTCIAEKYSNISYVFSYKSFMFINIIKSKIITFKYI